MGKDGSRGDEMEIDQVVNQPAEEEGKRIFLP